MPCFEEPFVLAAILEEVVTGWEVYTSKKMDETQRSNLVHTQTVKSLRKRLASPPKLPQFTATPL